MTVAGLFEELPFDLGARTGSHCGRKVSNDQLAKSPTKERTLAAQLNPKPSYLCMKC